MLVDGFELEPQIRRQDLAAAVLPEERCEAAALTKAMDLLSWKLSISRSLPDAARDREALAVRWAREGGATGSR